MPTPIADEPETRLQAPSPVEQQEQEIFSNQPTHVVDPSPDSASGEQTAAQPKEKSPWALFSILILKILYGNLSNGIRDCEMLRAMSIDDIKELVYTDAESEFSLLLGTQTQIKQMLKFLKDIPDSHDQTVMTLSVNDFAVFKERPKVMSHPHMPVTSEIRTDNKAVVSHASTYFPSASDFAKGIKCDISHLDEFTRDTEWYIFKEDFITIAEMQGVGEPLTENYLRHMSHSTS